MGFTAAAVVIGGATVYSADQQRKAAHSAADRQREEQARLEALQKEIAASEAANPMPTPDDQAQRRARQRAVADYARRRGRSSTILTGNPTGDSLGGGGAT